LLSPADDTIDVYVDCTDSFCLIPTDDIGNAVAGAFVSTFQTTMQSAINTAASTYINTIPTTIPMPGYNIDIELQGGIDLVGPPNVVAYAEGVFTPDTSKQPPFSPSFVPPSTVFTSPANQLDFIFTDFMVRTAVWAMDENGDFNMTITNADLPSNSPFHLKTSDPFFQAAVPALKHYPNMMINVVTSLYNVSNIDITTAGITGDNSFLCEFDLVNSTNDIYGWTLLVDISVLITATVGMNGPNISVTSTLSNWKSGVTVLKSNMGDISVTDFDDLVELAISQFPPPPAFDIPTPSSYVIISSPSITFNNGYGDIGADAQYAITPPTNQCGGTAQYCPEANTCCQWTNGWGCCTLPNAVCCDVGCCFQGSQCVNGGCE